MSGNESPGARILGLWNRLESKPGGRWLFHRLVGKMIPYTGAAGPRVMELKPGHTRVKLPDRRAVRNHLHSIHAVALVNVGEFASGLALVTALPPNMRAIVTELTAEYLKKARGDLIASSDFDPKDLMPNSNQVTHANIVDTTDAVVARVRVTWNVREVRSP